MDNSENKGGNDEGESLEGAQKAAGSATADTAAQPDSKDKPKKKKGGGFFSKFSVYLLIFVLVVVLAGIVTAVSYLNSKAKPAKQIKTQTLTQSDLSQLASSDVTVGDAKQVLTVQSNAVFAGQVLVRSDLQVAGKLQLGGGLNVSSLQVSGAALFGTAQVNQNLNVQGDSALAGGLTVQKSLQVNGGGTFSGAVTTSQLVASSIQLTGDLNLTHHISAGGVNPGRSQGSALGSGGTASVSGSDTAGSITINTGGGPGPGCLITVNFASKFNSTPHVVISPVGAGAGGLAYYVNRSTSSFTVCTNSAAPAGETFGFDYIVFD
jgi:cytoskeletal protein CcmA (bactofilin family)